MKQVFQSSLLFLGLSAALLVPSFTLAAQDVKLRTQAVVDRQVIRLSDVFEGVETTLDREIAIAPAPGKSVTYDVRVLSNLSERYALGWRPQSLSDRTVLTRAATHITPDMIRDAVQGKIKLALKDKAGDPDIQFDNRILGLTLPGNESAVFDLASFDYDQETQRFRGDVVAQSNGQPVVQAVMGHVVMRRKLPVLAHHLAGGTVLSESDLRWVTIDEARLNEDVLVSTTQIVGRELARDTGEGERLRARDVMAPRLVRRGTLVTLKVETPFMLITTQGRAMQDGAKGEAVRVTNTQSNRVIEGTVIEPGVVRVGSLRRIASAE
jgi:flagella basal body P-ring formation protein FlgA